MKAISIRQPWAWAICHAGKRIENRGKRWFHRGLIAIHASKGCTSDELTAGLAFLGELGKLQDWPGLHAVPRGAIVAVAAIVDCVDASEDPWFCGPFGLVLDGVIVLPRPVPCAGALGAWRVPALVQANVETQILGQRRTG